jgi:hypothetical protein
MRIKPVCPMAGMPSFVLHHLEKQLQCFPKTKAIETIKIKCLRCFLLVVKRAVKKRKTKKSKLQFCRRLIKEELIGASW